MSGYFAKKRQSEMLNDLLLYSVILVKDLRDKFISCKYLRHKINKAIKT